MGDITKSLWTNITHATAGVPASTDLLIYAPQPGTDLVTECKKVSVADLIASGVAGMSTYSPAYTNSVGGPLVFTTNSSGPQQFYYVGNVMTVLFDLFFKLDGGVVTDSINVNLPLPLVADVVIDNGLGLHVMDGTANLGGKLLPCQFLMFDGTLEINVSLPYSIDGVTKAVTSDGSFLNFPVDPNTLGVDGEISFQFSTT